MFVSDTIESQNLIAGCRKIAVAVSGGSDSMALLHFLFANRENWGIEVICVNVEHGIRGGASRADTEFVRRFCRERSIPFLEFAANVPAAAIESGRTIEQAARDIRYGYFYKVIEEGLADRVAVAHNAQDNAESVLMHLFRGSGLSGVTGMAYDNGKGIIRPLLDTDKESVLRYVGEHSVPFREDETNADTAYTRNFIRREVLPLLQEKYPGVQKNLLRFAKYAAEDEAYLTALANKLLKKTQCGYSLACAAFSERPLANRALRLAFRGLGVFADMEAVHYESVARLVSGGKSGSRLTLAHGIRVYLDYDRVSVERPLPVAKREEEIPFSLGEIRLFGRRIVSENALCREPQPGALYACDCPLVRASVWRGRRRGDTFQPFGGGSKKLNAYLSDKKIPARLRDTLPILGCGSTVLAVAGVEISELIKSNGTDPILKIFMREEA